MVGRRDGRRAGRAHKCCCLLRWKGIGLEDPPQSDLGRFVLDLRGLFFLRGLCLALGVQRIGREDEPQHHHDRHPDQHREAGRLVRPTGLAVDRDNALINGGGVLLRAFFRCLRAVHLRPFSALSA